MIRNVRNFLLKFLLLFFTSCLSSCIYEYDNCPDKVSFTIVSEWSQSKKTEEFSFFPEPEGMSYVFFPDDGSPFWRFDFPGCDAGKVSMSVGDYKFLSFNDDTSNVLFRGEDTYFTYEAYTPETDLLCGIPSSQRGAGFPQRYDECVVASPDMIWGCSYGSFILDYDGLNYIPFASDKSDEIRFCSPELVLTARQRPLTARYRYRIEHVENLAGVKYMSAALSGLAGSMLLASGKKGAYPSTVTMNASSVDDTTIGGGMWTFGIPSEPTVKNFLSLFVVLKDGRRFCYDFDVTDQVRSASDPMNVVIVLRGLVLEVSEEGENSAFDVNVDGWITTVVNIKS